MPFPVAAVLPEISLNPAQKIPQIKNIIIVKLSIE